MDKEGVVHIYTMDYYSVIKRNGSFVNEIGSFVEMWMDLKTVIQREISQREKNSMYHHFMGNRWGNSANSVRLYFLGLQNHC